MRRREPRIHFVKKARRAKNIANAVARRQAGIELGTSYFWWWRRRPYGRDLMYCFSKNYPRRSRLLASTTLLWSWVERARELLVDVCHEHPDCPKRLDGALLYATSTARAVAARYRHSMEVMKGGANHHSTFVRNVAALEALDQELGALREELTWPGASVGAVQRRALLCRHWVEPAPGSTKAAA